MDLERKLLEVVEDRWAVRAVEMTEQEEHEIRQYVESQTSDQENEVQLVQRVGRRRVAGSTHDLYDVWMSKGDRWWVITGMTNLYSQEDFHDLDQVFTFHLGLCALLREKFRIEADEESAERGAATRKLWTPWARLRRPRTSRPSVSDAAKRCSQ
jgi:hypothetical protein